MKLVNSSEQFEAQFNGTAYTIPKGEFEVNNAALANHILFLANKWGKDVKNITVNAPLEIKPIEKKTKKEVPVAGGASTATLPKGK